MQAVHESGHVLAAALTRGVVQQVDLHPLHISRTTLAGNPAPRIVCWSGGIVGSLLPLLVWLVVRHVGHVVVAEETPPISSPRRGTAAGKGFRFEPILRFFAGFCLLANGVYLGSAAVEPVGDPFDLLQMGVPRWQPAAFALLTVPWGLWLWDGVWREFGIGRGAKPVTWRQTVLVLLTLAIVIAAELAWTHACRRQMALERRPPLPMDWQVSTKQPQGT